MRHSEWDVSKWDMAWKLQVSLWGVLLWDVPIWDVSEWDVSLWDILVVYIVKGTQSENEFSFSNTNTSICSNIISDIRHIIGNSSIFTWNIGNNSSISGKREGGSGKKLVESGG